MKLHKFEQVAFDSLGDKGIILKRFYDHVLNQRPDVAAANPNHCGKVGYWLESKMGIVANGSNAPDLFGYEMKTQTKSKISFGDWSPEYTPFKRKAADFLPEGYSHESMSRNDFMEYFGSFNHDKGRYSWSGSCIPKIDRYSSVGTILRVNEDLSISIVYYHSEDPRPAKNTLPASLQRDGVLVAHWPAQWMKRKLEDKFNNKGWFKCGMTDGVYDSVSFGAPMTYDTWIGFVRSGEVYFDSGMYQGNARGYCQWRAGNALWNRLVVEKYII